MEPRELFEKAKLFCELNHVREDTPMSGKACISLMARFVGNLQPLEQEQKTEIECTTCGRKFNTEEEWNIHCENGKCKESQSEIKTAEEILEKRGLYMVEINGHKYSNDLIEAMEEYASQFKIELPTDGEINSAAIEFVKLIGSVRYIKEARYDFLKGAKWCIDWIKQKRGL